MTIAEPTKVCNGPLCEGQRKPWGEFYRDSKTGCPRTYCKECDKVKARDWQQANRASVHAHQRTYRAKVRADPELCAERITYKREWRRRRDGILPENYRTERKLASTSSANVDPEPFAVRLREIMARDDVSKIELAARLGLSARTVVAITNGERVRLDLNTIERALLADDTITLRELYPALYQEAA